MGIRMTNEEFIEKLTIVNDKIIPMENYIKSSIKIKFKCSVCGNKFYSTPNNILCGHGCPKCAIKIGTEHGVMTRLRNNNTTLKNIRPNLSKCLMDHSIADNIGYTSTVLLMWKCPICGHEFEKAPCSFLNDYLVCPNCIKNDSYPNRFMFNILQQCGIEFEREYSPEWIYPKRFDFYFKIKDKRYIVEMDGGFHRYKDVLDIDKEKDEEANKHGIEVIRINCEYNKIVDRYDFIKNNLINSKLYNLLPLKDVIFEDADCFALKNECQHICDLWAEFKDVTKIREKTKLTLLTIRRYLRFGAKNKMCSYDENEDHDFQRKEKLKNAEYGRSMPVKCDQTGEVFPNMKNAGDFYNCNVSSFFYQNRKSAGKLEDGTKLTWSKITREEYQQTMKSCNE